VSESGIDLIQLHGDENSAVIESLDVPVIKVLHVDASESNKMGDLPRFQIMERVSLFFLNLIPRR
jgi:phosphoribosylanthranilate isomerase